MSRSPRSPLTPLSPCRITVPLHPATSFGMRSSGEGGVGVGADNPRRWRLGRCAPARVGLAPTRTLGGGQRGLTASLFPSAGAADCGEPSAEDGAHQNH